LIESIAGTGFHHHFTCLQALQNRAISFDFAAGLDFARLATPVTVIGENELAFACATVHKYAFPATKFMQIVTEVFGRTSPARVESNEQGESF